MRKTGKNKAVAMLIVVAMVIGMLPMGVLPAFAATSASPSTAPNITVVVGTNDTTGLVKDQVAGDIKIQESSDDKDEWVVTNTTVNVALPTSVFWAVKPTVKLNGVAVTASLTSTQNLQFSVNGTTGVQDIIEITGVKLNVGGPINTTTTPTVDVTITGPPSSPHTVKIAKLKSGLVGTAAAAPADLKVGENGQTAGQVTITEAGGAGIAKADSTVSFVLQDGVTFFEPATATASGSGFSLKNSGVGALSADRKTISWEVSVVSTSTAGTIVFTPKVNVPTGFAADVDVNGNVTSSDSNVATAPAKLKIGHTSAGDALAFSTSAVPSIAKAANQTVADITVQEAKKEVLKAGDTNGVFKISIVGGSANATFASTPQATPSGGLMLKNSAGDAVATAVSGSLNSGLTEASWTITDQSTAATGGKLEIKGIVLNVNQSSGSVKIKIEGAAFGTTTKELTVGNVSAVANITVAASSVPSIAINTAGQAAGDIIITEAKAGALKTPITLRIFGVTADKEILFTEAPTVSVTKGDITVGSVTAGETTVTIPVSTSTEASTIKITGIKFDVSAKAVAGSVQVIVSHDTTGVRLASVSNAFIGTKAAPFPDVPANHWAVSYIENLVARGILAGYTDGTFKPSNTITRAEIAKMVAVAKGLGTATGSSFSDTSGHWAVGYIEAIKTAGYINGYPDGTFRPNNNISRAEIAKIVVLAAGFTIDTSGAGFSDIAGHWASDYILTAANRGVVGGYTDGTFRPNNSATRAEASKMVSVWVNM